MKNAQFTTELLITALCLYMIYTLAMKPGPVGYNVNPAPAPQIGAQSLDIGAASDENVYKIAAKAENPGTLNAIVREEAQRMVRTGDISRFEEELEKNSLLLNVIGY